MAVPTEELLAAAAQAAAEDPDGPFVIVTGSGDRIPESPVYKGRAAAELALGIANRRAGFGGRPADYQLVPAPADAGSPDHG